MQPQRPSVDQVVRWCLIAAGIVLFGLAMLVVVSGYRTSRMEVFGHADDYSCLDEVPALARYLGFFPRTGKHFYYWCRPYQGDVAGAYEISEQDFVNWAESKGWELREARGLFESFAVPRPDGNDTWVELKNGFFYQKQMPRESTFMERHNELGYQLDVYYDRAEGKVYFSSITLY